MTTFDNEVVTKKFYCNERAAMDFCMIMSLTDLDPDEPVHCMTMEGIVSLSISELKRVAIIIGRHFYAQRQAYWGSLV